MKYVNADYGVLTAKKWICDDAILHKIGFWRRNLSQKSFALLILWRNWVLDVPRDKT